MGTMRTHVDFVSLPAQFVVHVVSKIGSMKRQLNL